MRLDRNTESRGPKKVFQICDVLREAGGRARWVLCVCVCVPRAEEVWRYITLWTRWIIGPGKESVIVKVELIYLVSLTMPVTSIKNRINSLLVSLNVHELARQMITHPDSDRSHSTPIHRETHIAVTQLGRVNQPSIRWSVSLPLCYVIRGERIKVKSHRYVEMLVHTMHTLKGSRVLWYRTWFALSDGDITWDTIEPILIVSQ